MPASPEAALTAVAAIGAVGQVVSGAQLLARPRWPDAGGWQDWAVLRPGFRTGHLLPARFGARAVMAVAGLRMVGGAAVLVAVALGLPLAPGVAAVVAANLVLTIRLPLGVTGADEMGHVVFAALLPAVLLASPAVTRAALAFVALQACLAYAAAGGAKLRESGWRDGTSLRHVLATAGFGSARMARGLDRFPAAAGLLARGIVLGEIAFPLVLLLPPGVAAVALGGVAAFHLVVAWVMGLNLFVWSFVATLPAVAWLGGAIQAGWAAWGGA
ncbi:MAG: hypothetical protein AB7H88_19305 [Vicinamibacterales bacterium]